MGELEYLLSLFWVDEVGIGVVEGDGGWDEREVPQDGGG